MHGFHPKIDHLASLLACSQLAHVLIKGYIIIISTWSLLLNRFDLDTISNVLQILLFFRGELRLVVRTNSVEQGHTNLHQE